MRTIHKALSDVQADLKAPKNNKNTFGNYNYRSAEDILEAVKPILKAKELAMTLSDKVVQVGDKNYIEATVTVFDLLNIDQFPISVTAYAREAVDKKGMDDAQITGAASSYARKYALNGMFNIDDTKDPDTDEHTKARQTEAKTTSEPKERNTGIPVPSTDSDVLARAKTAINEKLVEQGYDRADSKRKFISVVLEKETIDNLDDADLVMDALENEQ